MANTLSTTKMTNPIRGLVSKRRIRYIQDGFDLDLTYINDRIIAMGYPAEQLESLYRNKIEDVQKMLEKNHAGCYKIYNLCSERNYNHERFPCYSGYPFKDHNPPDIELINSFCKDVDDYLRADSKNVVAVHCKAGKGRTGTMICCYLLYSRQFNTAAEALHYYGQRRTRDSKGVTIPSQRRYVEYYATLLRSSETYRPVTLYICEIRLSHPINVKEGTITVKGQNPLPLPEFKRVDDSLVTKLDYCMPLAGDVKIEFVKSLVLRKEKRCHFWFNTYFVDKMASKDAEGNLLLTLSKSEIDDAHKDKQHKEYPSNFTVKMVLRRVPPGKYSDNVSLKKCHSPVDPVTNSPIIKCNMENNSTQQHLPHSQPQPQHQQRLFQQSLGQNPIAHHRQLNSEPYWPTVTNYQNLNCIDGNIKSGVHGAQCNHHQPQISTQQQQISQTMLHDQRCDMCEEYENNHCVEYSETSSSESSTEEEGWDSGECCPPLLLAQPSDNVANLYYRNDNYYYGSCAAGVSAAGSNASPSHPASPTPLPTLLIATTTPPNMSPPFVRNSSDKSGTPQNSSSNNYSSDSKPSESNPSDSFSFKNNSGRLSNGSAKLNQSLVSTSAADSASFSLDEVNNVASLRTLAKLQHESNRISSSSSNNTLRNSIGNSGKLSPISSTSVEPLTKIASSATNHAIWPITIIGLKRKKKKSFKSSSISRDFGSSASTISGASSVSGKQNKVKSGKSRFQKLQWLKTMRSDSTLKEVLAKNSNIVSFTQSPVGSLISSSIPVASASPKTPPLTASKENLLSLDYYSSICDKQLSFESPCKSPGQLMKQNLASAESRPLQAIPDSECAIVIAKPSEQRLKIGFDVSPSQTPTNKTNPNNPLAATSTDVKSTCDKTVPLVQEQQQVDSKPVPRSYSLVPKSENSSFCDRILQTIVSRGSSSRKSLDNELQVPSTSTSGGNSPIAPRVNRCSPFSFRELGQELKAAMMPASNGSHVKPATEVPSTASPTMTTRTTTATTTTTPTTTEAKKAD
ncbi:uncharacterized protein LOC128744612 isoform X1 [Sabethes cyaneus]|uniref:uncharacterized protein LOC128744612 isoform X1 n=1 Tax=Sabethes cyaneus TaxID=53552 RepID=UPI00237D7FDD|nr:uncharacterized protein LOC128744612 isoform X1 [Sabethes cyaneus]XP_053697721.1 uncharacterized protein LOC128744612 isoform X1 [Sabethes cyaneus]XP_053697722.1 uncharacterized protein LOC128744612 isoform X1 [Sabethes cyaneus]XP_053697723.1 uncharacterized protein LOC128744612 isoform X1 [Sabethes cyaneus]XP_053697724.1 uncharacterized protein LOC128744612 isoform X1 [Sabethes cyaneus]